MKEIIIALGFIFTSCNPESIEKENHCYKLMWQTTFEDNSFTIVNQKTNDTVYKSKSTGTHQFELKKGFKYHLDIRQDKLSDPTIRETEIMFLDVENGKVLSSIKTRGCLRNWGYYIKVD